MNDKTIPNKNTETQETTRTREIVYIYNSNHVLKSVKTFDTLEECFNFVSEQNKKYTMNVKKHNKKENPSLELDLF